MGRLEEGFDFFNSSLSLVAVLKRDIAYIGDVAEFIRIGSGDVVDRPHQARFIADLTRAMAGTRPVAHPSIIGDTNERDIQTGWVLLIGSAHKSRNSGEAGGRFGINRFRHIYVDPIQNRLTESLK